MRPRFRPAGVIIAILAAILLAAPAAAASPWVTFKQSGTSAVASTGTCTENADGTMTCQSQHIDAFEGTIRQSGEPTRRGDQVCYSESTDTFDPITGELIESHSLFGCAVDTGTVTINNLTSITLASTDIELTAFDCDPTSCTESPGGSTTVQGTWTGIGPITSQKGHFSYDDGTCVQVNADRGSFRQASFDGSIDALDASIGQGSFTFRTTCAF